MKFGAFYELQVPRPWQDGDERRVFEEALEQAELLDRVGFHSFWLVEHHFLEEYSHTSAPEVFLGALSQRTKDLRLGHGIMHALPGTNHPARQAERIATLDVVSGGRVEFGTGEGSSAAELDGFGIDPADKRRMWEEGLRVALRCLVETPFTGFAGEHVTMPPRNVVPKPVQKPHPPVWVACTRRDTIHLAAQVGIGALSFSFFDPEEARAWVEDYYTTLAAEGVPIGDAVNANLACVTGFMCHHDEGEAVRRGAEGSNFLGYSLGHYYVFGRHRPGGTDLWADYQERRAAAGYDPSAVAAAVANRERLGATVVEAGTTGLRGALGTPDQVREYFRRYEQAGVDMLILSSAAGRNRHEHIMESFELIAREVLPEFVERDAEHVRDKARRLAPVIEAVMARKPASDHPPLDADYMIPAYPRQTADDDESNKFNRWLDAYRERIIRGEDVSKRLA
ncbi:MAG TPA: LLM class flavin-dependent oxidoreductase [Acidimicrobiales bacterium]|nr:LLM class flavin-dependent oxidoreductase [Acidimicrobiales bacterium]